MGLIEQLAATEQMRDRLGFLGIGEVIELASRNLILDPFSVLISRGVVIGADNVFYPNVVLQRSGSGGLRLGSGNKFFPGFLALSDGGEIEIGDGNQFGDGLVILKANVASARIVVGNGGRYLNGVTALGRTRLGSGSQILGGPITVQDCELAPGDTFAGEDPDRRAAVLKGFGTARGLQLGQGDVVNGMGGALSSSMIERQLAYHPRQAGKTT